MTGENAAVQDRIEALRSLRAVRSFRAEPLAEEVLDDVLEVARWSGSSMNRQPWELVVVWDRETLRALASAGGYADHLAGAAVGIVIVMAGERAESEAFDEGRLAERIMLAAHAHGVGSSVGWFAGGGRDEARRILGVPEGRTVRTAISMGYPDASARATRRAGPARKPLSEIVRRERYG